MKKKSTNIGSNGGLFEGPGHDKGGIPVVVKSTGEPIEVEGGEIIINREASKLHCEELSKINQSAGNGVAIPCGKTDKEGVLVAKKGAKINDAHSIICENCGWGWEPETSDPSDLYTCHKCNHTNKYRSGGKLPLTEDRKNIYKKWNGLVNMSKSELEKFYNSEEGKVAGLSTKEAKDQGIHSGRESARWIIKMLDTPKEEWSPTMWAWANRQISFISRMSGMRGGLYDDNGKKTRKHLALLIWGHDPKKKAFGGKMDELKLKILDAVPVKDPRLMVAKTLISAKVNRDKKKEEEWQSEAKKWEDEWRASQNLKKGGKAEEKLFSRDAIFISKIIELENKYVPTDERLIDVNTPNISAFRNSVTDWVKNPKNNVKVIIAFSGGKDSVALVLHALFNLQIPKEQIELWHHEVDGFGDKVFDWQCTPSYCQAFADKFELPLLFSYRKNGIVGEVQKNNSTSENVYFQSEPGGEFKEWVAKKGTKSEPEKYINTRNKFPGTSAKLDARWCSSKVKIEVMARAITNDPRFEKGNFLIMTGERREESTNRSGYAEIEPYVNMTKSRTCLTWRTIIDMTEKDIWELMEKHKIQPHPCYMLGWGRCSCQLCIFNDADTFATIREVSPEKIQKISDLEKQNVERGSEQPYLKSYKPKKSEIVTPQTSMFGEKGEFDKEGNQGIPINKWIDKNKGRSFYNPQTDAVWLKQALGEFTSPIIVENWVLPKGAFSKKQNGAN